MDMMHFGKISLWGALAHEISGKLGTQTTEQEFLEIFTDFVRENVDDIFYYNKEDWYVFGRKSDFAID